MRKAYTSGESLIDIIFSNGDVKTARAGGSMLNSSVSLGRAGVDTIFLSEFGQDKGGEFIAGFLTANGVNTTNVYRYEDGKTAIALAFLNDKGDASYEFYKSYPEDRLRLEMPPFTREDFFLFGSFFGIDPAIREQMVNIASTAAKAGAMIIYDPNFRKPHAHELERLRPLILENIRLSTLVKASDEDLEIIFGSSDPSRLSAIKELENKPLIITRGASGVEIHTAACRAQYPAPKIEVVSTIGAGDNFNAGLIFGLMKEGIYPETIHKTGETSWKKITEYAMAFAANVCMSYDNYISPEFAKTLTR